MHDLWSEDLADVADVRLGLLPDLGDVAAEHELARGEGEALDMFEGGLRWHGEGAGVGDDAEWPPEASLLILGMPRAEATALGHAFAQRAVVWGGVGEPALLLICARHSAAASENAL